MADLPKNGKSGPIAGGGIFGTICTAVCIRCESSTNCRLCRFEPCYIHLRPFLRCAQFDIMPSGLFLLTDIVIKRTQLLKKCKRNYLKTLCEVNEKNREFAIPG